MKKLFLPILCIWLIFSCGSKDKLPKGVYPKDKMASYLKDIYLLEAKIELMSIPFDSARVIFYEYEDKLKIKHQIDDSVYKKSFSYYIQKPKHMADIYSLIADSLGIEERLLSNPAPKD